MEQVCDLEIISDNKEHIQDVMKFLAVDRNQRSDNPSNLFDVFEKPTDENSLCTGFTDSKEFDDRMSSLYSDPANDNHIYFKSFRKNLFRFAAYISEKFPVKVKMSWIEQFEGNECLFIIVVDKSCVVYSQKGVSYRIAPNVTQFIKENNLEEYCDLHTRKEREQA